MRLLKCALSHPVMSNRVLSNRVLGIIAGAALVVPAATSLADVSLSLSKKGAIGTTLLNVPLGGSFDISVTMVTTPPASPPGASIQQVTGVDYALKATLGQNDASGIFTLASQDLSTSVFPSFNGGSFSSTVLNPFSQDVGSGLNDPFNQPAVSGGPLEIADYHVVVSGNAIVGSTYTLAIADNGTSTLTYAGPATAFTSGPIANPGSVGIKITAAVPEPTSIAAFAVMTGGLVLRRRRSN